MVAWKGPVPSDKTEWIDAIRGVFAGTEGTYRILFRPGPQGWRFDLEVIQDVPADSMEMIANGPETIRFNLVQALKEKGKPVDPDWREPGEPRGRPR